MTSVARRGSPRRGEEGFTLVEVLLSMVITVAVMTALMFALVSTLRVVAQAKERQTATALATQVLERMRALPASTVTQPSAALPTATNATASGPGVYQLQPAGLFSGPAELLIINVAPSEIASAGWPGSGQRFTETVEDTVYAVESFVSYPDGVTGGTEVYNLTAIVSWTSRLFPEGRTVVQRSTLFTGGDCLSGGTSPYAAPCQGFFTAKAGVVTGGISVSEPFVPPATGPDPETPEALSLLLTGLSADINLEQTAAGSSRAAAADGQSVTAAVDSDPSSASPQQQDFLLSSSAPTTTALGFTAKGFGTSGEARAGIQAGPADCVSALSTGGLVTGAPTELRPCTSAYALRSSTATLELAAGGVDIPLATVAPGTRDRVVGGVLAAANPGVACTASASPSCGYGAASRSLGTVSLGTGGAAGAGWDGARGLLTVTGLEETARAEEGVGAELPVYTRGGSLEVWNGTGYTPVALADFDQPGDAEGTFPIPATTVTHGTALVTFEGEVVVQPPAAGRSGPADCEDTACVSDISSASMLTAQLTVTVVDGATTSRFTMSVDLGGLIARASYKVGTDA